MKFTNISPKERDFLTLLSLVPDHPIGWPHTKKLKSLAAQTIAQVLIGHPESRIRRENKTIDDTFWKQVMSEVDDFRKHAAKNKATATAK
jgi:hypothetical protein